MLITTHYPGESIGRRLHLLDTDSGVELLLVEWCQSYKEVAHAPST
jgi:hypothetical protein